MSELESLKTQDFSWSRKVQECLGKGQKARALKLLERVIEYDMPLFSEYSAVMEDRRVAWLYRIALLREWGRPYEALAWTCLECELNPKNVAAFALKESLKETLAASDISIHKGKSQNKLNPGIWKGVAGMREVKALLERDVILPLKKPLIYSQFKINPPNGVIFYGPPGCGKTFIATKLASILNLHFIDTKPSDLASTYVHGGQMKIRALFERAEKTSPTLLFLDELDALAPNRGDRYTGHHYKAEVNEFLVQLNNCWNRKILVIAATNLLENIDPAILRPGRFDRKIFIGPPDLEARAELLKLCMDDRPQEKMDWMEMSRVCEYYTSAEIENLVNVAAGLAVQNNRLINGSDLYQAMEENPPVLSSEKIEKMRSRIGFV